MRPIVSPGGRPEPRARPARAEAAGPGRSPARGARAASPRSGSGMTVRRLVREAGDGYSSRLAPGVRSIADAERLAHELAFAAARLGVLAQSPPGPYAEVADPAGDVEERTWLAFQIALLGPLQDPADGDPFAAIAAVRTSWASGAAPALTDAALGPRGCGDAARGARACDAYRAWTARLGSQTAAIMGEASWSAPRRFDRAFERLGTLASLERDPRFELLVTLDRLGVHDLRGERLHFGSGDPVTLAAKRILGIGDPLLLERRAADLAEACGLPLEALDLGFFNWERGSRYAGGVDPGLAADPATVEAARAALGLD